MWDGLMVKHESLDNWSFPRHLLIFSRSADVAIAANAGMLLRTTNFGASCFCLFIDFDPFRGSMNLEISRAIGAIPVWTGHSCKLRVLLRKTAARQRCALRISVCNTSRTSQKSRGNRCFGILESPIQKGWKCFQSTSEEMLITFAPEFVFAEDFRHLKFECHIRILSGIYAQDGCDDESTIGSTYESTIGSTCLGRFSAILCTKGM